MTITYLEANEVAREVSRSLAREDGNRRAGRFGADLRAMQQVAKLWSARRTSSSRAPRP